MQNYWSSAAREAGAQLGHPSASSLSPQPLVPQGPCTPEELGNCSSIAVEDIGDTRVTVFRQDDSDAQISTVLLRGGTKNGLDDLQRSIGACGRCLLRLDC